MNKILARISLLLLAVFFIVSCISFAYADDPEPNFTEGSVNYYLSAPDTMMIELSLYGEHSITLKDGETVTIMWETEVPQDTLSAFNETVTAFKEILVNTPAPEITPMPPYTWPPSQPLATTQAISYNRQMMVTTLNTLAITYSRAAYLAGQPFLTGELTRTVTATERIASEHIIPIVYEYGLTEEIVQELASGNFQSITPQNTMQISFPVVSQEIVNRIVPQPEPPIPTRLDEMYAQLTMAEEYLQNIYLPPEFIALIPQEIIPQNTETIIAEAEQLIEEGEELVEEAEQFIEENGETLESGGHGVIPTPNAAQVMAGAITSAVVAGVAGSVAAGASSSAGVLSVSASGLQGTMQGVMQGAAATSTGHAVLSFLKDLITGLRDMFVDEGRAHASGKVTQNLKKD